MESFDFENILSGSTVEASLLEPVRLRCMSPVLWRDSLKRLREDFLSARKELGPLRCPLFQYGTGKSDAQEPPFDMHAGSVSSHTTLYHQFRMHVSSDGMPIYLRYPIIDDDGKPIIVAQCRGWMCEKPAFRQWSYCGEAPAGTRLSELAERGGRALLGTLRHTIAWIPHDTLFTQTDEYRWVWSIFDLAWQGRHPSLRAERKTWFRHPKPIPDSKLEVITLPYVLRQLRAMRNSCFPFNFPEEWTERLPGYFISELPDLFEASVDLIDTLLNIEIAVEAQRGKSTAGSAQAPTGAHVLRNDERTASEKVKPKSPEESILLPPATEMPIEHNARAHGGGETGKPTIPPRALKAGEQYKQAIEALGVTAATDRELYGQLAKAHKTAGESFPTFPTWQRNLREYRRLTNQQKYGTHAKVQGGSMVRPDQIEPNALPTRIRPRHNP
ncbi:MAG: hypothetical protein AABZ47_12770 [Planctomycetota bacterium]